MKLISLTKEGQQILKAHGCNITIIDKDCIKGTRVEFPSTLYNRWIKHNDVDLKILK